MRRLTKRKRRSEGFHFPSELRRAKGCGLCSRREGRRCSSLWPNTYRYYGFFVIYGRVGGRVERGFTRDGSRQDSTPPYGRTVFRDLLRPTRFIYTVVVTRGQLRSRDRPRSGRCGRRRRAIWCTMYTSDRVTPMRRRTLIRCGSGNQDTSVRRRQQRASARSVLCSPFPWFRCPFLRTSVAFFLRRVTRRPCRTNGL